MKPGARIARNAGTQDLGGWHAQIVAGGDFRIGVVSDDEGLAARMRAERVVAGSSRGSVGESGFSPSLDVRRRCRTGPHWIGEDPEPGLTLARCPFGAERQKFPLGRVGVGHSDVEVHLLR